MQGIIRGAGSPYSIADDLEEVLTNKNRNNNNKGTFLVVASPTTNNHYSGLIIERSSNSTWSIDENDSDSLYARYQDYLKHSRDGITIEGVAYFLTRFGRYNNTTDLPPLLSIFMEERGVNCRLKNFSVEK